jgi:aquaporin Z
MDATYKKYLAEFLGTAVLVLMAGSAMLLGTVTGGGAANTLLVALSLGLAWVAVVSAIGGISGGHINPAVTLGAWFGGKFPQNDLIPYILAQILGALAGAALLAFLLSGKTGGYNVATSGLGQNGWGAGYLGAYSTEVAFVTECVATFIFVYVVLTVGNAANGALIAGLTLAALYLAFSNVTGLSTNPARSLGSALMVKGHALEQIWMFIVAPAIGGVLAGLVYKNK